MLAIDARMGAPSSSVAGSWSLRPPPKKNHLCGSPCWHRSFSAAAFMKSLPLLSLFALLISTLGSLRAASPFPGEKGDHHGAALYSFDLGSDKVSVLVPSQPLPGKAWILAPSLYNSENPAVANLARTELELVKRGFHVVTLNLGNTFGAPQALAKWDALYREMTETYGLNKRIALMGLSREGLSIARWAA
ncbi:MAG: hypothetical protein EBS01_01350, partial [Verrucomicrobia bacterium]|nr:hypothetical protein [Verrucomicrobiota bacterium]